MQDELKAKLEDAARAAGRSLNAEIVQRLQATFEPPVSDGATGIADLADQIGALRTQIDRLTERQTEAFLAAVKAGEIAIDKEGRVIQGPNFKLGTKLDAKPQRAKRKR